MAAAADFYRSPRLAYGYAHHRPPVHQQVIARLHARLALFDKLPRALDIGCGAGLSTAALLPLAHQVTGIEPIIEMLAHRRSVTTQAQFVAAKAEQLPFASHSFDLLTAAGALNYADLKMFFHEAVRVLDADGVLVIYDFSEGRRLQADPRLENWYAAFKQRYPAPPGYAMDVRALEYQKYDLRLDAYEEFEVAVPLTCASYLRYVLSETSVELAVSRGTQEKEIRDWCEASLREIFGDEICDVYFDAYLAVIRRSSSDPSVC
jgi:SAM-dependent methyltransferase